MQMFNNPTDVPSQICNEPLYNHVETPIGIVPLVSVPQFNLIWYSKLEDAFKHYNEGCVIIARDVTIDDTKKNVIFNDHKSVLKYRNTLPLTQRALYEVQKYDKTKYKACV